MTYPTPPEFISFLDANPGRYKNDPEGDGYNSTQAILDEVTKRPMVQNPVPVEQVPAPLDIPAMQAVLGAESIGRLSDSWWDIMLSYVSGTGTVNGSPATREDAKAMVDASFSRGNLEEQEVTDLKALIDSTIDDPDYQTEIQSLSDARAQWNLGGMSAGYVNNSLGRA